MSVLSLLPSGITSMWTGSVVSISSKMRTESEVICPSIGPVIIDMYGLVLFFEGFIPSNFYSKLFVTRSECNFRDNLLRDFSSFIW